MTERTDSGGREFPQTRWTLILSVRERPEQRRAALEQLLGSYWRPLYFFARRKGLDPDAAQDAVQGFLLHVVEHDVVGRADPAKGRFRAYLRAAFAHFLVNLHAHATAQKRGGGVVLLPLDVERAEQNLEAVPESADAAYDREWAIGIMERALHQLEAELKDGRWRGSFAVVARFFRAAPAPPYAEVAASSGMSVPQLKAFLHRTRVRFRALLRAEVADTLAAGEDVDAEIRELMRALNA